MEYVVQWGLEHRELGPLRAIGVDEIHIGQSSKFLTLVYQIEAGCTRLLWVGKDRTMHSFEKFLRPHRSGAGRQGRVRLLGRLSGQTAALPGDHRQALPQGAQHPGRFHTVAKLNKALDEVRAGEARRMIREGCEPVLKKQRWCLLKRPENLTDKQRLSLRELLGCNLKSVRAYLLKEAFQLFWEYDSPTWAAKFLDAWCQRAMRSRIEPVKKFARTVRAHRELLLNYFRAKKQFSSGVIEGLNNKAKVTLRKACGYRTFRIAELSLYHVLGRLPEPKLAHRFF